MKRKIALDIIRIEVAQNGEVTREAMRAYAESRIGYAAYDEAVKAGFKLFKSGGCHAPSS